jgi:hypothetical protein
MKRKEISDTRVASLVMGRFCCGGRIAGNCRDLLGDMTRSISIRLSSMYGWMDCGLYRGNCELQSDKCNSDLIKTEKIDFHLQFLPKFSSR